ncbi:hypothetical protein BJ508DRAFT_417098 [Ascobolus immersus RN42]|uniref:DUF2470 domain-containing protein n=1 Tax=Ascobolus immersus RN42 TaxID=1160509 RepID=A0A3N4HU99_ASCIM|nr:hypothetical protein BJ508DRAFT_417098 [Ascobolus immersus RN42]
MTTQRNVSSSREIDPSRKTRIIEHMNNDHSSDISMYLQYYSKLPEAQADTGRMEDMTLDGMVFTSRLSSGSTTTTHIPFKTPLTTAADARNVLVEMSGEAADGLGLSKVKLDSYLAPSPVGYFFGCAFLATLVIFATPEPFLAPGKFVRETVLMGNATIADVIREYHWIWFVLLLTTHMAEMALMTKKMKRYRVKEKDVWWKWVGTTLVVGFDSFSRLKAAVEAKRH